MNDLFYNDMSLALVAAKFKKPCLISEAYSARSYSASTGQS